MRNLSKLFLASLLISVPVAMSACDDGAGDGEGGNGNGGPGGEGGTGANSGSGAGSNFNPPNGNVGGGGSDGGVVIVEPDCEGPKGEPFVVEDCLVTDGPSECVTGITASGAFVEGNWLEGWTNWSTNSTPEDAGGTADGEVVTCTAAASPCQYDGIYTLSADIYVESGATIEFAPGSIVRGSNKANIIVMQGGKIEAEGTLAKPIIFTSAARNGTKRSGQWGGIVMLGEAQNSKGIDVAIEGLAVDAKHVHGGTSDSDNSGTLKYVRLEFGGSILSTNNEINGLTLGSVGSGTVLDYIQVNTSLDDGFEWFGGTASASHLVSNNAGDDMFDTDDGFRGSLQYLFGRQVQADSSDPNGFEFDGTGDYVNAAGFESIITEVDVANATICGIGGGGLNYSYGMVVRRGQGPEIGGSFESTIMAGFDAAIDIRERFEYGDPAVPSMSISGSWAFQNYDGVAYAEAGSSTDPEPFGDDDEGFNEDNWFKLGEDNAWAE